jgi:hypothetical protein
MTARRLVQLILASCLGFVLLACEQQKIGDITADPGRFRDKEVAVVGRVVQSFGVLGKGIYQVEDSSGNLWVMSENRGVPSKGAYVGVKGRIIPTVTFMGRNYATVMRESGRKTRDAEN